MNCFKGAQLRAVHCNARSTFTLKVNWNHHITLWTHFAQVLSWKRKPSVLLGTRTTGSQVPMLGKKEPLQLQLMWTSAQAFFSLDWDSLEWRQFFLQFFHFLTLITIGILRSPRSQDHIPHNILQGLSLSCSGYVFLVHTTATRCCCLDLESPVCSYPVAILATASSQNPLWFKGDTQKETQVQYLAVNQEKVPRAVTADGRFDSPGLVFLFDIVLFHTCQLQGGHRVDIIDHWSIIDHFAQMVDILDFVVDVLSKWSIFHQNLSEWR